MNERRTKKKKSAKRIKLKNCLSRKTFSFILFLFWLLCLELYTHKGFMFDNFTGKKGFSLANKIQKDISYNNVPEIVYMYVYISTWVLFKDIEKRAHTYYICMVYKHTNNWAIFLYFIYLASCFQ